MRVELRLAGLIARVECTPFERRTGNITWAPRGRRLPASFTVPPGATVSRSVHLLMHLTQLTCGARARASAAPGATESSTTDSTADVPAKRIPAANNRIGARFGGRQLADPAAATRTPTRVQARCVARGRAGSLAGCKNSPTHS